VDTFFLPTSRAPEEQRQSRRSHSGGKAGESGVSAALGDISRPDRPIFLSRLSKYVTSEATSLNWVLKHTISFNALSYIHPM
jgi:hypothetical protein